MATAGICHTDLSSRQIWPRLSLVFGHEALAPAEAVGAGARATRPGDKCVQSTDTSAAKAVFAAHALAHGRNAVQGWCLPLFWTSARLPGRNRRSHCGPEHVEAGAIGTAASW
ncbi:alcohol dehydrogenase catalytic domain-containing protein [Streptomyces sp. N2A]|uniref:alcohol dehydrogenase catalytic domain-containing protein n=1 Tax=Streptomyces sp. N2A TaxID=3073936 RepID=UPI0028707FFC|nr:alcohol dehydrogenase catalytic domain-containing protein [Streptomyces sp. N2A]